MSTQEYIQKKLEKVRNDLDLLEPYSEEWLKLYDSAFELESKLG
jgi:hypothetical protein